MQIWWNEYEISIGQIDYFLKIRKSKETKSQVTTCYCNPDTDRPTYVSTLELPNRGKGLGLVELL